MTSAQPVDLAEALSRFAEPWQPRTVAVLNDYAPPSAGRGDGHGL